MVRKREQLFDLEPVLFPSSPADIPDDTDGPYLAVQQCYRQQRARRGPEAAGAGVAGKDLHPLSEDLALALGLLFKLLAPLRNVAAIENSARGIDAMACMAVAYWLATAMHRRNPRRVLAALRMPLSAS
jgi:hypothetical protein